MKTFQFAGCSRVNGELKFRTAMSQARAQQLAKLGDTDVNLTILPKLMSKAEAAKWCLTSPVFDKCGEDVLALFTTNAVDENPFVAKAPKAVKKPKTVKVTVPAAKVQGIVKPIKAKTVIYEDVAPSQSSKDKAKARAEFMKMLVEVRDEVERGV
jgi:hypothetical protein